MCWDHPTEWKGVQNDLEKPDEVAQNGRSEPPQADENPGAASVQVKPLRLKVEEEKPSTPHITLGLN